LWFFSHLVFWGHNTCFVAGLIDMVSLELFPKKVLGNITLNPNVFADEIKRHPEVETFLVTRDNRTEVMREVLDWLMEG